MERHQRHFSDLFVMLSFLVAAVRGLNITRCIGPYNDSYTCPALPDPPERTRCCLWNNQPSCCLPRGSSCSDSADKRNYCPRPTDDHERTQCCVWDSQPACCLSGGSSCRKGADKRNYCPGPNDEKNDRDCCANTKTGDPKCCRVHEPNYAWIAGLTPVFIGFLVICGACCAVICKELDRVFSGPWSFWPNPQ